MNLTSDPWIPVVRTDGHAALVSLREAFVDGHAIRDLAVRPHERIALMRLLVCVAQAALDGPTDRTDWRTCAERLPAAASAYLDHWRHTFELFGKGPRFLQTPGIEPSKEEKEGEDDGAGGALSKLDLTLASGNNSTLFDNAGGTERRFAPARVALMLLAFQNFSASGTSSQARWHGALSARIANAAPCLARSMLHTYRHADSLLWTLHANLLTKEQVAMLRVAWGVPVWHAMPSGPKDTASAKNATQSYLGRLVPLSRLVYLADNGTVIWGQGLRFDPEWREPAATVVIRKDKKGAPVRAVLSASLDKSLWRELPAISAAVSFAGDSASGPLALAALDRGHEPCDLWAGALVASSNAKLLDTVEAVYHLPAGMFVEHEQRLYQDGVRYAESRALALGKAVATYRRELNDELEGAKFRERGLEVKRKAAMHFWTAVEQHLAELLGVVEKNELLYADGATRASWHRTAWGQATQTAARDAYELACPHTTPRQLRAYTLGQTTLLHQPAIASGQEDTMASDTESDSDLSTEG